MFPQEDIVAYLRQHVAQSLMIADISQISRSTKYANVTITSNDHEPPFLVAGIRPAEVEARAYAGARLEIKINMIIWGLFGG